MALPLYREAASCSCVNEQNMKNKFPISSNVTLTNNSQSIVTVSDQSICTFQQDETTSTTHKSQRESDRLFTLSSDLTLNTNTQTCLTAEWQKNQTEQMDVVTDTPTQLVSRPQNVKIEGISYTIDPKKIFTDGDGSEGEIYRATGHDNKRYILKIQASSSQSENEIRILSELGHLKGFIRNYNNDNEDYLLLFDYGIRLSDYLDLKMVSTKERSNIAHQLKLQLKMLHDMDYCHGDIKAKNIVISNEGVPTIIDFGNATQHPDQTGIGKDCRSLASLILQFLDPRPLQVKRMVAANIRSIATYEDLDIYINSLFPITREKSPASASKKLDNIINDKKILMHDIECTISRTNSIGSRYRAQTTKSRESIISDIKCEILNLITSSKLPKDEIEDVLSTLIVRINNNEIILPRRNDRKIDDFTLRFFGANSPAPQSKKETIEILEDIISQLQIKKMFSTAILSNKMATHN